MLACFCTIAMRSPVVVHAWLTLEERQVASGNGHEANRWKRVLSVCFGSEAPATLNGARDFGVYPVNHFFAGPQPPFARRK